MCDKVCSGEGVKIGPKLREQRDIIYREIIDGPLSVVRIVYG